MNANLIYFIGVGCLVVGTVLTYYGSHLKSDEGTTTLNAAISKKDSLIDNLNSHVTDLKIEQQKLLLLQEAPMIKILPADKVKGNEGIFELSIVNAGLSDIVDIDIYEDYYVAIGSKDVPVKLNRFGAFLTVPNSRILSLHKGETKNFRINYKNIKDQMLKFYLDENVNGQRTKVSRIKVNLIRKLDGKKFSYSKVFIIAAGDLLFDYDASRDIQSELLFYSYNDIKQILGATL